MRFSVNRFNRFLNQMAQAVEWRSAARCPCRDPHSGAAKYGCEACAGSGVVWGETVATKTALAAMKVQRQWADFGMWENGDVVLTIPSDAAIYDIREFDRVMLVQSEEPFSFTLTHDGNEKLTGEISEIEGVQWLAGAMLVTGGIPHVEGDGTLSWDTGEPPAGDQYTVSGKRRPEYFCFGDFPQDRHHQGGLALPRRVVLRRFDLFSRESAP
jgi:hypothetical protein